MSMRSLIIASIAMSGLAAIPSQAAPPAVPTLPVPNHCDQLEALVVKHQSFIDGKVVRDDFYPVPDLVKALKACPAKDKYAKAFDTVLAFEDVQAQEDGPHGQVWLPTATGKDIDKAKTEGHDQAAKAVDGYAAQIKRGDLDETAFKAVLHYMAWQSDDPEYASLGCELAARMYPEDFDSVSTLSHGLGEEACDDAGKEFMPKTPPKH